MLFQSVIDNREVQTPVAIVGAGPAGIAMAVSLRDRGMHPLVIDKGDVAASWRARYDRLKLNTGRPFSHLPRRPYPRGTPMFPTRADVVAYYDGHAREPGIELRLDTEVTRIDRRGDAWLLRTTTGDIHAKQVVVATGQQHTPRIPDSPGGDDFTGTLLHSSAYRNPTPFIGQQVLVVGAGASGMEIAYDLATGGAHHVSLAVRSPPNIMLRSLPGGLPSDLIALPLQHLPVRMADAIARTAQRASLGDLARFGLPIPDEGVFARDRRLGQSPTLVDMDVIDAVKDGSIGVVAAVAGAPTPNALAAAALVEPTPFRPLFGPGGWLIGNGLDAAVDCTGAACKPHES